MRHFYWIQTLLAFVVCLVLLVEILDNEAMKKRVAALEAKVTAISLQVGK